MTTAFQTLDTYTRKLVVRMALLLWGFAWLSLSVLIFMAGRLIPHLQPKPPPLALKARSRSPRVRSVPVSPIASPPKSIVSEPEHDELTSYDSSIASPAQPAFPPTPTTPNVRTPPKRKWSLNTHFFSGRIAPSPKSSLFSPGSSNGSGGSSPPRFFPELPIVESASPTSELGCEQDRTGSSRSTPTGSPRPSRALRLPGVDMLKSLSRKMSTRQKSDSISNRSRSPTTVADPSLSRSREGSFDCEGVDERGGAYTRRRASTTELPGQARPGHLLHHRNHSSPGPGEVFTTSFVNPFRSRSKSKSRKAKTPPAIDLSEPVSPSPRRSSAPRRMLSGGGSGTRSRSQSQSRRSSMSSTSTGASTFSAPPVLSGSGAGSGPSPGSSSSPRSVPRTQPYAAPYFAAMPRSGRSASKGEGKEGRPGSSRRASSLSPPRRPETVAEESAEDSELVLQLEGEVSRERRSDLTREEGAGDGDLSALGLKLGQLGHGRPRWQQRQSRQRVAVSESAVSASAMMEADTAQVLGMSEVAVGFAGGC
ncbi:hypothetical protein BV20DRAFT_1036816 [Pilatotrama ljubarskyi]|nr:hypothetical protein BV20DRAFT_1036816 [Pilatotrama ljubarskyi]